MRPSEKDCCTKSGLAAATNTGRLLVASVGGPAGCRTCTMDVRAAGAMVTPGLSRAYATSDGTTTAKLKTKPLNNSAEPPRFAASLRGLHANLAYLSCSTPDCSQLHSVRRALAGAHRHSRPARAHRAHATRTGRAPRLTYVLDMPEVTDGTQIPLRRR